MAGNKYLKAGIWYTVGNYLLKGLTFLTLPIFARLLSKADYGQYSIFTTYEMILYIIIGFAIHTSYKNAFYKYKGLEDSKEYNSYISATMLLLIGSAIIWLFLSLFLNQQLSRWMNLDGGCIPLLVVFSSSSAVITCYNTDASIRYEYKRFLQVSFFNALTSIVLSIVLILFVFKNEKYLGRIIGSTVPYAFVAIAIVIHYMKQARPNDTKAKLSWGVHYSLPIIPHGLSQIILNQFDRIMIMNMVGSAMAGVYSFAYNVYMIITVTASSIDNVWAPWLYERRNEDAFDRIKKVSSWYFMLLLLLCVIVSLASPELVLFFGGNKYKEAVYCVVPIVTSGFFAFSYNIPASIEYYHEKTKGIAAATISAALINIVMNYLFIKRFGYIAAAYTTLFTYFLYFSFHMFMAYIIEKKMMFNAKIVLISSIIVVANNFLTLRLVECRRIRYMLILIILSIAMAFEEKEIGLINARMKKYYGENR